MMVTYQLTKGQYLIMTNATATLTEQYVMNILHEQAIGNKYPVDFDEVWQSAGYTTKSNAYRFLVSLDGLKKGKDYEFSSDLMKNPSAGRPKRFIKMTVRGYRFFLGKSNTKEGTANMNFLLDLQDAYLADLERRMTATPQVDPRIDELGQENEQLKADLIQVRRKWEYFAEDIALIRSLREQNTKQHNENFWLKSSVQASEFKAAKLQSQLDELKELHNDLQQRFNQKLSKDKLLAENNSLREKITALNKVFKVCKEQRDKTFSIVRYYVYALDNYRMPNNHQKNGIEYLTDITQALRKIHYAIRAYDGSDPDYECPED